MTKHIKLALLASLAAVALTSAHGATYNGDLIVGFTTASPGNDFMYDIGAASALTDGKTWNLSSYLAGVTNMANLNIVNWGVIGDKKIGGVGNVWLTFDSGIPQQISSLSAWGNVDTALKTTYAAFPAAGAGNYVILPYDQSDASGVSWYEETILGYGAYPFVAVEGNPNTVGKVTVPFYLVIATNAAPAQIGTFTLSGSGTLTYNVYAGTAPAPSIVSVSHTNFITSVSFTTASGSYTYSLHYTNSAGLTAPVANWPKAATTVTGDGSVKTLTNTNAATDADRFYRIGVQ